MCVGFCICEAEKRNNGCWQQRLHTWSRFGPGVALPGGKKGDLSIYFSRIIINFLQSLCRNYVRVHDGIGFNKFMLHPTLFWARGLTFFLFFFFLAIRFIFLFSLFSFYSHKIKSLSVLHSTSVIRWMRLLAAGYKLITMAHCRRCSSGERLNWWSWRLPGGMLTRPNLPRRLLWVCTLPLKQWSTCSVVFYTFNSCVLKCNWSNLSVIKVGIILLVRTSLDLIKTVTLQ